MTFSGHDDSTINIVLVLLLLIIIIIIIIIITTTTTTIVVFCTARCLSVVLSVRRLQPPFDFDSTGVRRVLNFPSKVIKGTVT